MIPSSHPYLFFQNFKINYYQEMAEIWIVLAYKISLPVIFLTQIWLVYHFKCSEGKVCYVYVI